MCSAKSVIYTELALIITCHCFAVRERRKLCVIVANNAAKVANTRGIYTRIDAVGRD